MVKIVDYKTYSREDGVEFYALVVQGELETVKSKGTGKNYFTARKANVPCTFGESICVGLIGNDLEGYIEFETNRYPVPYEYVADILTLKATEHEVIIYSAELALLVHHQRLPAGSVTKLDPSGIHSSRKIRYSLEPVQDQFLAMGDHSRDFLDGLKQQHPKNCGFHARYILRQKEKYHPDDIDKAMAHAAQYHAYDCKAIERILLAKSSPRTLEAMRNEKAAEELRNALPEIKQRSLAAYDSLLEK